MIEFLEAALGCLLYSLAFYPAAFFLPCSACCGCSACADGKLPETVTVTLDGLEDRVQGPPLVTISFQSCTGFGGTARVTDPGGDPDEDAGPVSAVAVQTPGQSYAVLGRVEPELSASGNGTGADLGVLLSETTDDCGLPAWEVTSVTVNEGGEGYSDGDALAFTGGIAILGADARVRTVRSEPDPFVSGSADLTLTLQQVSSSPLEYGVDSVTVNDGGSGYFDGQSLFVLTDPPDREARTASLIARTVRAAPTITHSGTADLTIAVVSLGGSPELWEIGSVTVNDGGSGYSDGDLLAFDVAGGDAIVASPSLRISATGGAITSVNVESGGQFFNDTGVIESVEVADGGAFFRDTGEIDSIEVNSGGLYYAENPALPALVPNITATVTQNSPSDGTGAEFAAVVDDDPASPTFGSITSVTIQQGGDDYLAWRWINSLGCGTYYNGVAVVLKQSASNKCFYEHRFCGASTVSPELRGRLTYEYKGPGTPGTVTLSTAGQYEPPINSDLIGSALCDTVFTLDDNIADCGVIDATATAAGGATATIVGGGEYDAAFRNPPGRSCSTCCRGDEEVPEEILVTVENLYQDPPFGGRADLPSGDYIFARIEEDESLFGGPPSNRPSVVYWFSPVGPPARLVAFIEPCYPACVDTYWTECRLKIADLGGLVNNFAGGCSLCVATPFCYPTGEYTIDDEILEVPGYRLTFQ